LAGMDVFGAEDDVELAVLLDDVALADGAGDDSQGFFPELLASGRSGQVCPWPTEAVSGRNILIWPADATLFRLFFRGSRPPLDHGVIQPWRAFGLGSMRDLALCSAKAAGTENLPVWVS